MAKQQVSPVVIEGVGGPGGRGKRVALALALLFCVIAAPDQSAQVARTVLGSLTEFVQSF